MGGVVSVALDVDGACVRGVMKECFWRQIEKAHGRYQPGRVLQQPGTPQLSLTSRALLTSGLRQQGFWVDRLAGSNGLENAVALGWHGRRFY